MDAPTDDLVRLAAPGPLTPVSFRAADDGEDGLGLLHGHFTPYGRWTEIDSYFEGNFMERTVRGSMKKTINDNGQQRVKVLYDHGNDPSVGNKPLGPIRTLREEDEGPYYEVPLIDTSYNRDLLPALKEGLLGASYRFRVVQDEWNDEPGVSDHNPKGIPERTIKEVRLFEFGPVTFPAYAEATAAVRSGTDDMIERLLANPVSAERVRNLLATSSTEAATGTSAATDAGTTTSTEPPGTALGLTPGQRAAALRSLNL